MRQAQKPGRRVVSKGEYASHLSRKATLSSFGISLCAIGEAGLLIACFITLVFVVKRFDLSSVLLCVVFDLIVWGCSIALLRYGLRVVREARDINPGVPLTRANTGDLPAPDSLVRASQEPMQAQQTILLRAASETPKMHEEQLLRPRNEQE